jgi:hypothetical protein
MSKCQSAIPFPALLGRRLSLNLPAWAYGAARIGQTIPKRELLALHQSVRTTSQRPAGG